MNINAEQEKDEKPVNTAGAAEGVEALRSTEPSFEECIAALIIGKLALYGYLHASAMGELTEVKDLVTAAMGEGFAFFGETNDLQQILNESEMYRLGRTKGGDE